MKWITLVVYMVRSFVELEMALESVYGADEQLEHCMAHASDCQPCTERDLEQIAKAHRDAWDAAFERRALTDREFAGLADAQAVLDCLEQSQ